MASSRALTHRSRPAISAPWDVLWNRPDLPGGPPAPDIDWDGYAGSYDAITQANPAYRALTARVAAALDSLNLPRDARVADLGCGTGTFTGLLLDRVPDGRVFALDHSPEFLAHLDARFGRSETVRPMRLDMDRDALPGAPLDAVVAIHVLCHAVRPVEVLRRIHDSLRPGGSLIVADIGRPLVLGDWSKVVVADLAGRYARQGWGPIGILPALAFLMQHRGAARENRRFARRQQQGLVWMHSLDLFVAALHEAGFEVVEADDREFRGIDSFAIARRPGGVR